jgi:hypothetical protein
MHHDDAEPLSPAPNQTPHHIDTVPDVEAGSRVVRKQSWWIDRDHHGEQNACALPTAERRGKPNFNVPWSS